MKIGEEITKTIKCVKATNVCQGCMFAGIDFCESYAPDSCSPSLREDGEAVIFVEVV